MNINSLPEFGKVLTPLAQAELYPS